VRHVKSTGLLFEALKITEVRVRDEHQVGGDEKMPTVTHVSQGHAILVETVEGGKQTPPACVYHRCDLMPVLGKDRSDALEMIHSLRTLVQRGFDRAQLFHEIAGRTTAGRPDAGTGSAEAAVITRGGSGGTAGAAGAAAAGDWQYTDAPVRFARSMLVLNRSHEQIVSCLSWAADASRRNCSTLPAHVLKIWRQNTCTKTF